MEDVLFGLMIIVFLYIGYRYMNRLDHAMDHCKRHSGLMICDQENKENLEIDSYQDIYGVDFDVEYSYSILMMEDDFKNLIYGYKLRRMYPHMMIYSLCNDTQNRKIYLKNNIFIIDRVEIENIVHQYESTSS